MTGTSANKVRQKPRIKIGNYLGNQRLNQKDAEDGIQSSSWPPLHLGKGQGKVASHFLAWNAFQVGMVDIL